MRVLRFFVGIFCAFCGIIMLYFLQQTLSGSVNINPELLDSTTDEFFWILLIGGCSSSYLVAAVALFKGSSVHDIKFIPWMIVPVLSFAAGLYYHLIFQSPW